MPPKETKTSLVSKISTPMTKIMPSRSGCKCSNKQYLITGLTVCAITVTVAGLLFWNRFSEKGNV